MLPSELFAPPPRRSSQWVIVAIVAMAGVAGLVILSFFIDALHLSMARGETLRLSRGTNVAAETSSSSQKPPVSTAQLQLTGR